MVRLVAASDPSLSLEALPIVPSKMRCPDEVENNATKADEESAGVSDLVTRGELESLICRAISRFIQPITVPDVALDVKSALGPLIQDLGDCAARLSNIEKVNRTDTEMIENQRGLVNDISLADQIAMLSADQMG